MQLKMTSDKGAGGGSKTEYKTQKIKVLKYKIGQSGNEKQL